MNKLHIFVSLTLYMIIATFILGLMAFSYAQESIKTRQLEIGNLGDFSGYDVAGEVSFSVVATDTIKSLIPYTIIIVLLWLLPLLLWILILLSFIDTPFGSVDVGN